MSWVSGLAPSSRVSRRELFGQAAMAATFALRDPLPSRAIINGDVVSREEAAAVGAVGLWIDLDGCEVCRHDVPAACTGTLVAPNLVLSAKHCIDVPDELGGKLTKVVFSNDIFDKKAPVAYVDRFIRTSDYGMASAKEEGDLVLIKLKTNAPIAWQPQQLALDLLPSVAPGEKDLTQLIGRPELFSYGFGDAKDDYYEYSSGRLQRLKVKVASAIGPSENKFYTTTGSTSGTCNGDSGGLARPSIRSTEPI